MNVMVLNVEAQNARLHRLLIGSGEEHALPRAMWTQPHQLVCWFKCFLRPVAQSRSTEITRGDSCDWGFTRNKNDLQALKKIHSFSSNWSCRSVRGRSFHFALMHCQHWAIVRTNRTMTSRASSYQVNPWKNGKMTKAQMQTNPKRD